MDYSELLHKVDSWLKNVSKYQLENLKNKAFNIEFKDSRINYLTNIDIESEKRLISFIKQSYPSHSILGEETGFNDNKSEYEWVIDPIDGTTNYIHGYPAFTISIALKHKGITKIGVVFVPNLDFKFTAIAGEGAYLNGKKISVSTTNSLIDSLLSTGFQYKREFCLNLKYFNEIITLISDIRRTGSAALELCMAAGGFIDGFWEFDLNEWDTCAGELILKEAGGKISHTIIADHKLLISGNPKIHDLLYKKILEIS